MAPWRNCRLPGWLGQVLKRSLLPSPRYAFHPRCLKGRPPMFEIFSVGDSAYLQAVLNAIAMISGTGDYRTAAAVGSVMSNMGYRTTRLFEQGFGTPSMTGNGFADSLQTLTAVRKNLLSRVNLGVANVPNVGSDMETSFANYVRECTLTGVDLNQKSVDAILRDADPLNAIRFDSDIYMTQIYVGGQPQTKTCTDAWADLSVVANGNFATALEGLLQPTLGVQAAGDTVPKIQDGVDALAGPGGGDAADYMLMSAIG